MIPVDSSRKLIVSSVCAVSVTRFVMFWRVGHSFLKHYNDETCTSDPAP